MTEICNCCGKPLGDNKAEWGGLWLNLQTSCVSNHYHKECAEKVYEAIKACCERAKKEGAGDEVP